MLRNRVIAALLAGVVSSAFAANWESIYSAPEGTIWVDRGAMSVEHPLIHARLRIKLSKPDNAGDGLYDEMIVKVTFNCDRHAYVITYEKKWLRGKLVKEWEGDTDYIPLDPDRPLYQAARALCSHTYGAVQVRDAVPT
ncbi:surface-adhesin E family protein [Paraburkholderia terrae]